jgi:hypothetical protein
MAAHHEEVVAVSKAPIWLQDGLERVFKIKKRKSTIEVTMLCTTFYMKTHHNLFP